MFILIWTLYYIAFVNYRKNKNKNYYYPNQQIKSFIFESQLDGLQSMDKDILRNKKRVTEGQGDAAKGPDSSI